MAISVNCPSCGACLKAPDNASGKKTKCPECNAPVRIPGGPSSHPRPDSIRSVEYSRAQNTPPPVRVPTRPAVEVDVQPIHKETKACPYCGEQVLAVAKKCKHCGETIDVVL